MTTAECALETWDILAARANAHYEEHGGAIASPSCATCEEWRAIIAHAGRLFEAERRAEDAARAFRKAIGCRS